MGSKFKRALQVGTMLANVALGAVIWNQAAGNALVGACVFGLIALGVVGFGLSEFTAPAAALKPAPLQGDPERTLYPEEQRFADDLALIIRLLQAYLHANSGYSDSLSRANRDLPSLETPDEIRAVVLSLIDDTQKIQAKATYLSENLQESIAQIEGLRVNLAEATDQAMRDPLTSLGNRRFFDQKLDQAIAEARADISELCLAVCDLDQFKAVNDKFGHGVGDMALKMGSDSLLMKLRRRFGLVSRGNQRHAVSSRLRVAPAWAFRG